jgi:hypothetical protein
MYSYKDFAPDARLMEGVLSSAKEELNAISEKLAAVNATIQSMVPEIHRLSTPDTMAEFSSFMMREYHPALSSQAALTAKMGLQTELVGNMQQAMLQPAYLEELKYLVARDEEEARLAARISYKEGLIADAIRKTDEAEIRGKIKRVFVYPGELTERPSNLEEGVIAGVSFYQGGRTMTVNWGTPCVVVHAAGNDYVVCLFDSYNDRLIYRVVEEDDLCGPPSAGLV